MSPPAPTDETLATNTRPGDDQPSAIPPDSDHVLLRWPVLDRLALLQAFGGLILALIALFSSYDHIDVAGRRIEIQQPWGVLCILASLATVVIEFVQYSAPLGRDAELASRSRLRAAQEAARAADERTRDRDLAARERESADRERNRAAEARERQAESFKRLDQAAVLSARVQLDPSAANRERLRTFLSLVEPPASSIGED